MARKEPTSFRDLAEKLRDPFRLRMAVAGVVALVAFYGIYSPIDSKIRMSKRALKKEERRETLAQEVEILRAQYEAFDDRIQKGTDVNETIQYVLEGVRAHPLLKLINLDVDEERRLGPYRVVFLKLNVVGDIDELDSLLAWLESNQRLFRIDGITLEPARSENSLRAMNLKLVALKA